MSEPHQLIFPPFRLDVTHGRLCRGQDCVPMRLKTLAVLRYLIEHRDRVVSRDELSQAIWPGRFGADAAPKQCILELRKLLVDSIRQPRFIATVGRNGYRFIGLIEANSEPLAEPDGTDPDRSDSARRNFALAGKRSQIGCERRGNTSGPVARTASCCWVPPASARPRWWKSFSSGSTSGGVGWRFAMGAPRDPGMAERLDFAPRRPPAGDCDLAYRGRRGPTGGRSTGSRTAE